MLLYSQKHFTNLLNSFYAMVIDSQTEQQLPQFSRLEIRDQTLISGEAKC